MFNDELDVELDVELDDELDVVDGPVVATFLEELEGLTIKYTANPTSTDEAMTAATTCPDVIFT